MNKGSSEEGHFHTESQEQEIVGRKVQVVKTSYYKLENFKSKPHRKLQLNWKNWTKNTTTNSSKEKAIVTAYLSQWTKKTSQERKGRTGG